MKNLLIIILAIMLSGSRDPNENIIVNNTDLQFETSIIENFLNTYDIKGVTVVLFKTDIKVPSGYSVKYHMRQRRDKYYVVYINNTVNNISPKAIIHEMYHLKQLYNKELQVVKGDIIWYKGEIYKTIKGIPLHKLPWEKDIPHFNIKDFID